MSKNKVVSLFSGGGGLDLGFKQAGYDIIWAIDNEKNAVETYKKNIGNHIILGDINKIDLNEIPNADIVIGGPPCQSFSLAGKRNVEDARGQLVWRYLKIINKIKPKAFVFENVTGILSAKNSAGEKILDEISWKHNLGHFFHNVQSVRTLMCIEKNGYGQNITLQVLDGILCHNGEFLSGKYAPAKKDLNKFLEEYNGCYNDNNIIKNLKPMTLEGCVVRISDIIAYIGKDIEDAIRLNKIKKEDIPEDIASVLGYTNDSIVNNIIMDIIYNSFNKNYITMSDKVFNSLVKLKEFNYKRIYDKANSKEMLNTYSLMFNKLFEKYIEDLKNQNYSSEIYKVFLNDMNEDYINENSTERKVIDFIAGMTDDYFINQYNKYFK